MMKSLQQKLIKQGKTLRKEQKLLYDRVTKANNEELLAQDTNQTVLSVQTPV